MSKLPWAWSAGDQACWAQEPDCGLGPQPSRPRACLRERPPSPAQASCSSLCLTYPAEPRSPRTAPSRERKTGNPNWAEPGPAHRPPPQQTSQGRLAPLLRKWALAFQKRGGSRRVARVGRRSIPGHQEGACCALGWRRKKLPSPLTSPASSPPASAQPAPWKAPQREPGGQRQPCPARALPPRHLSAPSLALLSDTFCEGSWRP